MGKFTSSLWQYIYVLLSLQEFIKKKYDLSLSTIHI